MNSLYAYCGLNCAECPAYLATQANDLPAQERLLDEWRSAYSNPEMTLAAVTCDGCTSCARLGGYCLECPVRACGVKRGVVNCAYCPDYGCATLQAFFQMSPEVKPRLDAIRASR